MKIRLIPRIRYTNYRKAFPGKVDRIFKEWFEVERLWMGKIINIRIRHHQISLDFRKNWLADMVNSEA